MQIGASYMIQFNLVMGCGQKFTPHMDNQVKLEYSTNHGLTWHLVQEVSLGAWTFVFHKHCLLLLLYYSSEIYLWHRTKEDVSLIPFSMKKPSVRVSKND